MSLYRKYRPLTFAEIAGQEHIKQTLQNALCRNELVHAYLFSGPRAVGKTTTARVLTRAVNCIQRKEGESEPCNQCDSCLAILENRALDVIEIDAASHTGVDNVRDTIIASARVGRSGLKTKVFIIDEVHMLSTQAFNALLKTLEEPPSSVLFILATTELHKVPATIVSRCQRFEFKKIPPVAMRARLKTITRKEKKSVDDEVLTQIIRLADGCQRDAETLLGQVLVFEDEHIGLETATLVLPMGDQALVKELVPFLIAHDTGGAMKLVEKLTEQGTDISIFLANVLEYFRTLLLIGAGVPELVSESESELAERTAQAATLSREQLLSLINNFMIARRDLRYFTIPSLSLEVAIAKSCGGS